MKKEDISVNLTHALKLSEKQSKGPAVKSTVQRCMYIFRDLPNGCKGLLQIFKEVIGFTRKDIQESLKSRKTVYSIYILKKRGWMKYISNFLRAFSLGGSAGLFIVKVFNFRVQITAILKLQIARNLSLSRDIY